jgi:HK97 family phage major capsid protein
MMERSDAMSLSKVALQEQRGKKQDEMKAIMGKPALDDNDRKRFDELETEVRNLNSDIRRVGLVEQAERVEHAEPVEGRGNELFDLERRFNVGKATAEFAAGKLTGVEAEYNQEKRSSRSGFTAPVSAFLGERRAITTMQPAAGPGGNLVQTSLGPFIDRLRPTLAVEAMGATVLSGLTDSLELPRLKASGTASWNGEHTNATGSDPQFDKVPMGPKTVSAQYEVSRRMLLQATQLDAILRGDLGYLLAQALDGASIQGGGANQPVGILGNANVQVLSLGTNGAAMTVDTAADLMGLIDDANAFGNIGFLTNSKVKKAAIKLKDTQNRPYGQSEVFKQSPVTFTNQVPSNLVKGTSGSVCSAILYGVWSDLVIGYWSSVDIVVNPYADSVASKGGALMHAFLDADVAIRQPMSFAVAKDVLA